MMRIHVLYATIAAILMLAVLQSADSAPACYCMDYGRSCLMQCITDECSNRCQARKMRCYQQCGLIKRNQAMFDSLADEDMSDNFF
ncbi:hypothetical protein ACROYT_G019182 [Oculina patagonica]